MARVVKRKPTPQPSVVIDGGPGNYMMEVMTSETKTPRCQTLRRQSGLDEIKTRINRDIYIVRWNAKYNDHIPQIRCYWKQLYYLVWQKQCIAYIHEWFALWKETESRMLNDFFGNVEP